MQFGTTSVHSKLPGVDMGQRPGDVARLVTEAGGGTRIHLVIGE